MIDDLKKRLKSFNDKASVAVLLLKTGGTLVAIWGYLEYAEGLVTRLFMGLDGATLAKIIFYCIPIFAFLSLVTGALLLRHRRDVQEYQKYLACEEHFRTIASESARTDGVLFDDLFSRIAEAVKDKVAGAPYLRGLTLDVGNAISAGQRTIRNDIDRLLDAASEIIETQTGCNESAASFKRVEGALTERLFVCMARDKKSRTSRPFISQGVNETPFINLFGRSTSHFAIENIEKWETKGSLEYSDKDREGLQTKYSSILTVPVRELGRRSEIVGVLQIDNMKGGLSDAHCVHYITEISYRFSVLLYRTLALETWAGKP
jgi:hypothetical protein